MLVQFLISFENIRCELMAQLSEVTITFLVKSSFNLFKTLMH